MDTLDVLKEAIQEELFQREPLAAAIMLYLNKSDPAAHREILNHFDTLVSRRIDSLIQEALDNTASAKADGFDDLS